MELKLDLHLLKNEGNNDFSFSEIFFNQNNRQINHYNYQFNNIFIYKKNFPIINKIFGIDNDQIKLNSNLSIKPLIILKNPFFYGFEKNLFKLFSNEMDYDDFQKINKKQLNILKIIILVKLQKKILQKKKLKNFKKEFEYFNTPEIKNKQNFDIIKYNFKSFKNYQKKKFFKFTKKNYFEKYYFGRIFDYEKKNYSEIFKILDKNEKFLLDYERFCKNHLNNYLKIKIKKNIARFLKKLKSLELNRKIINHKNFYKFLKKNNKLISFNLNDYISLNKKKSF